MAILTISRHFGSLGTIIAKQLEEELDFEYLDKVKLEEILVSDYGIPEEKVEKYDEKKPGFWDIFSSDKDRYLHFMKTAIYEFAKKGNAIIIGRGGQVLLKNIPGIFHVRVVAPLDLRIDRIKQRYGYDEKLAEQIIRHSDHDRTGFHKFFFHVDWADASLYDLIINTQTYSVEQAVSLIRTSIELIDTQEKQDALSGRLNDLSLGQQVITHITYEQKIPIQFLEAKVMNGIVTLHGSTITSDDIARCEAAAREVSGIRDVINEVYFIPNTYGMT